LVENLILLYSSTFLAFEAVSPQRYTYNDLGFSITFPASWKGKYVLKK